MLTREQREKYTSGWIKRKKEKEESLKERYKLAMEKAALVAQMLRKDYGVKKVVLFGSLAKNKLWGHSDIDIAVEGLADGCYLNAVWETSEIASPFKVDLVPIERAVEGLKEKIKREGKEI